MRGGFVRLGGVDQRRHHHNPVDAGLLRFTRHILREGGGELGDAGDHRHFTVGGVSRHFDHRQLFLHRH